MASSIKEDVLASIERGTVFYYSENIANRDGTSSRKSRYFIVLNNNPKTDDFLVLATITKQIENQSKFVKKVGEDPSTLVPISPEDFAPLKVASVVSCNKVYPMTLTVLMKKIEDGGTMLPDKVPKPILSAIVSGVMKSAQVEGEYKAIIL
jgi:hypothetical protein